MPLHMLNIADIAPTLADHGVPVHGADEVFERLVATALRFVSGLRGCLARHIRDPGTGIHIGQLRGFPDGVHVVCVYRYGHVNW